MNELEHAAQGISDLRSATNKHREAAVEANDTYGIDWFGGQLAGLDLALLVLGWTVKVTDDGAEVTK